MLKAFLLSINFSFDLIPSLPYFFLGSIFTSSMIFLLLDIPVLKAPERIRKYVAVFSTAVYTLIVMLVVINIKIYLTLDTFITYPLLLQIADIDVFKKSLVSETDMLTVLLLLSGLIYAAATVYSVKLIKFKPRLPVMFVVIAAILISSSSLYSTNIRKELRSIDRDPVLELASSAFNIKNGQVNQQNTDDTIHVKKTDAGHYKDTGKGTAFVEAKNSGYLMQSVFPPGKTFTGMRPGCASGMNVVLFILESTTPRYLNTEVTPNILKLSRNALVLNSHYTTEPATLKAVYSLLTGRLPYVTRNWKSYLKESEKDVSFSRALSKKGYYTEFAMPTDGKVYYEKPFLLPHFHKVSDYWDLKALYPASRSTSMGLEDNTLIWYMNSFLEKHAKKKFFFGLASVNPHHPYDVCDKSYEVFGTKTPFDMYRNALRGADDVIGKCYDLLVKYGIEKNTLFAIVSDHGEAFYQHTRNYLHSLFLYEENVHTIAYIINPVLFPVKTEFNAVTSHIDIGPTILDMTGTADGEFRPEGISILKNTGRRAVFFTSFSTPFWGCRDKQYKYIFNKRYDTEELYDLAADPFEKNNIAGTNSDICKMLKND
jgi:arylsulfatase A-like enzyme